MNARVVVFDLQNTVPALLEPVADSSLRDATRATSRTTRSRFEAIQALTLARGTVTRGGQTYAEVAYPLGGSVVLLSSSLHDQLQVGLASCGAGSSSPARSRSVFAVAARLRGARALFARRIRRLERAAERIAAGRFDEPVVDHGSDELGQLARTFERMRLRLAHLDRARGEFIANASHELRTPLFSLGGFLELLDERGARRGDARRVPGRRCGSRSTRLTKLATDLLDLSRLDAGRLAVATESRSTSRELADELRRRVPRRARRPSRIRSSVAARGRRRGARRRRARAARSAASCVENALVHTPAGTTVRRQQRARRRPRDADGRQRRPGHPARRPAADLRALLPARRRRAPRAAASAWRSRASWRR